MIVRAAFAGVLALGVLATALVAVGAGALLAATLIPVAGEAQQTPRIWRVGLVIPRNSVEGPTVPMPALNALKAGLRELGYVEGRNFVVEIRFAELNVNSLSEAYQGLVRARADVLLASVNSGVIAAKRATSKLPIVMVAGVDPVGAGFVSSLARPNDDQVTGLTVDAAPETNAKNLQFLKEAIPHLHRVAVLWNPRFPGRLQPYWNAVEDAARRLRLDLQKFEAGTPDEVEPAFTAIAGTQPEGLLLFGPSAAIFNRERTVALAAAHRLPAIYPVRSFVEAGGLMSYGPNPFWFWRTTALYLDKLFKGSKPRDLPVEQPTKFELVVNMKTAKALGLTLPPSLLLRADQIIE